jgi:hypothetical protein
MREESSLHCASYSAHVNGSRFSKYVVQNGLRYSVIYKHISQNEKRHLHLYFTHSLKVASKKLSAIISCHTSSTTEERKRIYKKKNPFNKCVAYKRETISRETYFYSGCKIVLFLPFFRDSNIQHILPNRCMTVSSAATPRAKSFKQ